ncbi:hypothetical protein [Blastochloris viridis]|uniref:Uncharacterized protein n=1 Tax=Blastochloris viridis TaxID=1079 RepID=A0A182D7B2_BLAVI|nr:hypothetical protein [Blastochloris viridis]ALK09136.1 hypothetical protein BVIR_1350 [Blastochloris viridis]BAS00998.1 hypothetical protein BV133_3404 [Blastochloris viridis]
MADLEAAQRAFRLGRVPVDGEAGDADAVSRQTAFDPARLLALFLYAHASGLAVTTFAGTQPPIDAAWMKRFFHALAEFLIDYFDPAFPARIATTYAEAAAHGHTVSSVSLMSGTAGRTSARLCLSPLIAGPPISPGALATFCSRANAADYHDGVASPPLRVGLIEAERFFTLVRQTPRLRCWLDDTPEPATPRDRGELIHLEDIADLLVAVQPAAP